MTGLSIEKEHVIVGTAGHIDHGKSSLVKALTGTDPHTLPEEKERGLTIELGFVFMEAPGADKQIVFIDVPGHEKFVRTMAAGASNIDAVMLVIAADEGVNVQTREHFDILRLLRIPVGFVALTKSDLVDEECISNNQDEIAGFVKGSFLEGAPIIPVSSMTGAGLEEIRAALFDVARKAGMRPDSGIFRMPIDRVFVMQGFGTVVAGTILSGEVRVGAKVEIFPDKLVARVRGIQVHRDPREKSVIGRRTAINLMDVKKEFLRRGQVAATLGSLEPTQKLDARLEILERAAREVKNRERIRLHVGTDETIARLALLDRGVLRPGEAALVQFLLESAIVALPGDRFVIRTFSPTLTIGGGEILDASPVKHKRFDAEAIAGISRLEGPQEDAAEQMFLKAGFTGRTAADAARLLGLREEDIRGIMEKLREAGKIVRVTAEKKESYLHATNYALLKNKTLGLVKAYFEQNPHRLLMPFADLRSQVIRMSGADAFRAILDDLVRENILMRKDTDLSLPGREISFQYIPVKTAESAA